ncbi:hypothetical protein F5B22DRAFT_612421 [Xylaria bambusicola]|uniref:uncharacterized protein n=1 Tax=Xylaria bambusicola TaxID=326684 RepID=UPI002008D8AE|nr:uncharacterized protein F5B22DRAFT_612421 [Xylaria bambusicola]KAI0513145.1 hypothetical protein F5B22DRAFT_612421 [Xylaria bambusicola]
MDEYLFSEHLARLTAIPEPMSYLEILNYSDNKFCSVGTGALSNDQFEDFLDRKGSYSSENENLVNGIRLIVQSDLSEPETFASNVVSLEVEQYESLIHKMKLPFQGLEASTAVGPFFWWCLDLDSADPKLQLIFRKADAKGKGTTKGWEMMLTYCFKSKITSGYVKSTSTTDIDRQIQHLTACSRPVAHPLLLPILLFHSLSAKNDEDQRDVRVMIRELEGALSQRYQQYAAISYGPGREINLDSLNHQLTECQCRVLQKKPQAWRNALRRMEKAMHAFWGTLHAHSIEDEPNPQLQILHRSLLSRLDFLAGKLDGLENYSHVSLERLKTQREVMLSILDQRESRLSLRIAAQQHRLADASKRDSTSMKTLTFLGSLFLPGTFISSVFSMSFFDFSRDLNESTSSSVWLYFVLVIPLTMFFVGLWWRFDQARCKKIDEEEEPGEEVNMQALEHHIIKELQKRTGARLSWNTSRSWPDEKQHT